MERETQRQEERKMGLGAESWGKKWVGQWDRDEVPPSNSPFADVQISGLT